MTKFWNRAAGALLAFVMIASLLPAISLSAGAVGTGYAAPSFTIGVQGGAAPACHDMTLEIDADSCPEFDWSTYVTGYRAYESATGKTQEMYWQQLQAYLSPIRAAELASSLNSQHSPRP